jgi:Ribbon-helix-helix protein, copG family
MAMLSSVLKSKQAVQVNVEIMRVLRAGLAPLFVLHYTICMTASRHPLSVRLDPELAEALERHCAQAGASRSDVVKQSIAQYLLARTGPTLSSLAEAILPPAGRAPHAARAPRQKRFQAYVREKRRR